MKIVQPKTFEQMGKKGAFYRFPEKLAVGAFSGRRLWSGRTRGGSEIPVIRAGDSGQAGDSGHPLGRLRTPNRAAPHRSKIAEKDWGRRFRSFGRRLRWAGDSGPSPVNLRTDIRGAPHFGKKAGKKGDRRFRVLWPETPVAGDSGPSPDKFQQEKPELS